MKGAFRYRFDQVRAFPDSIGIAAGVPETGADVDDARGGCASHGGDGDRGDEEIKAKKLGLPVEMMHAFS
jgi:hypothetical protein